MRYIIAKRGKSGRKPDIQIRAESLRLNGLCESFGDPAIFAALPEGAAGELTRVSHDHKGHWRQADVKRAIKAAREAELDAFRIEIARDGTISIVVALDPED